MYTSLHVSMEISKKNAKYPINHGQLVPHLQLAYNQSQQIKEAVADVFDQYIRNVEESVQNLQDLTGEVRGVFRQIEDGLDTVQRGLHVSLINTKLINVKR